MTPEFWHNKWQSNKIGFNQQQPNSLLIKHLPDLKLSANDQVFVPLCGKSIDMVWLASQQLNVVGVELVEHAVIEFFEEHDLTASVQPHPTQPNLKQYYAQHNDITIRIWVGDIFELSATDMGPVAAVYDRAALVALPDSAPEHLRQRYVEHVIELTNNAPQLLLNFGLNPPAMDAETLLSRQQGGPPFVVSEQDLHRYYQAHYQLQFLGQDDYAPTDRLINQAWLLLPHG
ncbi:thiopurine S-methyltransferase [Psychrobacter sp. FDAARGOS_221]|uniref:thiopurine S-methyltransferase n=1 Tax=Psychrobacter sp. FDAARGOS_221 TaxID=1975705 RepID=UPI000BB55F80|nr:thiopurine S-methyltransferase [Psychrobacter sp. FDAARGOS_221]PNK60471.1 thiopurine S-methyltransferase [Psychrobacter sp. FDAARGOS_221]